jgi:hypothetical protein
MNEFVSPETVKVAKRVNTTLFPLERAKTLQADLTSVFSRYLGATQSGRRFEAEAMVVTGQSGSGKTKEIADLVHRFNSSEPELPNGLPARFVEVLLDKKGGWKDLGKVTLHAMGYPISDRSKLTQPEIWRMVGFQAKHQGIVGIHYDEAQHIFAGKSDTEQEAILDSFKTLLKSHECPLILLLSGVPELSGYVRQMGQLMRKTTFCHLHDIDFTQDAEIIHDIVYSYASKFGLDLSDTLNDGAFLHRLATASAFRWGVLIDLTTTAIMHAKTVQGRALTADHFNEIWVAKTKMNAIATPFTHPAYETMFRREKLFWVSQ